ncbi:MAG: hypothetical protein ACREPR_18640 [Brasilonema sp.]
MSEAIANAPNDVQEVLKEIYEEIYEEVEYEQGKIRWGLDTLQYEKPDISLDATNILQEKPSEVKISDIIQDFKNPDYRIMCNAIENLKKIDNEPAMPVLIQALQDEYFVKSDSGNNFPYALLSLKKIQKRCKFYNYEIAQSPPSVEENQTTPKPLNTFIFHQPVGNLITGDVNIHGDQIGTQHN